MHPGTTKVLACLLFAVAVHAMAQQLPTPYRSDDLRGLVVDDAGKPVEGVVVVARWEWLAWVPPRLHGGGYFQNSGEAVHVGESVTSASGEYRIAGWGPTVRAGGKMEENQPQVFAFKSGYEPFTGRRGDTLRLAKSNAPPAEYADLIAKFQQGRNTYGGPQGPGTLAWRSPNDDWRGMPRMIEALHREKVRLGADGAKVLGANLLQGRSGEGVVQDAESKQPVQFAVVSIAWSLRRSDGSPGEKRIVQTKWISSSGSRFWVSPWRTASLGVPGWEIDTKAVPVVRAYAPGYRRSTDVRWPESGAIIAMQKLPEGRDAVVTELGTWKRDVDAALAMDERPVVLPLQRALLSSLAHQCNQLTADLRAGICFSPGSEIARWVEDNRNSNIGQDMETEEGSMITRVVANSAGPSAIQAQRVSVAPSQRIDRPSIGGFRIEPAR